MNIYVGNLAPETTESVLREAFGSFGTVGKISLDDRPREGKAYSFCFVEMSIDTEGLTAILRLHGKVLDGHALTVRESGVTI